MAAVKQLYAARMSESSKPEAPTLQMPDEDIEDEYLAKKPTAPQVTLLAFSATVEQECFITGVPNHLASIFN